MQIHLFLFADIIILNATIVLNCDVKVAQSCLTLRPHGLCSPWNFLGQNTGGGSLSLTEF